MRIKAHYTGWDHHVTREEVQRHARAANMSADDEGNMDAWLMRTARNLGWDVRGLSTCGVYLWRLP